MHKDYIEKECIEAGLETLGMAGITDYMLWLARKFNQSEMVKIVRKGKANYYFMGAVALAFANKGHKILFVSDKAEIVNKLKKTENNNIKALYSNALKDIKMDFSLFMYVGKKQEDIFEIASKFKWKYLLIDDT